MNNIINEQSSHTSIQYLKAIRVSYSKAKRIVLFESLNVILSVITFIFLLIFNSSIPENIKISISTFLLIVAIILNFTSNKQTEIGAKIQEMFDCNLFKLQWNPVLCGNKILSENIIKLSSKYTKADIENWYTNAISANLNLNLASIFAQCENLLWDIEIRKKYKYFTIVLTLSFYLLIGVILIIKEITLLEALILILPTASILKFMISNIIQNQIIISDKTSLRKNIDSLLTKDNLKNINIEDVRNIQNLMFTTRKSNCLIPDWFNKLFRDNNEQLSYDSIELKKQELGV